MNGIYPTLGVVSKIIKKHDSGILQVAINTQVLWINIRHENPLEKCIVSATTKKKKKEKAPNQTAA